jgi:hypothetical protein
MRLFKINSDKRAGFYASAEGRIALVFFALIMFVLFLDLTESYYLNCSFIATGSCSYSSNLSLLLVKNDSSGYDDAHAQNVSVNTYPYSLCCNSNATLGRNCSQAKVLNISDVTNAHVQQTNYTGTSYPIQVCLSSPNRTINCSYFASSCGAGYGCIASMASSETSYSNKSNAHIGSCSEYNMKICCRINNPPVVTLSVPADNNITTNRTPFFNWTATDPDGDPITGYEINITAFRASGSSTCIESIINATGTASNFTPLRDLKCMSDAGMYYLWSVRANDSSGPGDWTTPRMINITAYLATSLSVSVVDFGILNVLNNSWNDTKDDSPFPFNLSNDGNCFVNVSINGSPLWSSVSAPNIYYNFSIRNATGEEGAFIWAGTQTNYTQMPTISANAIYYLNYSDAKDSAYADIYIKTPPNEPPSIRNSTVVFTSYFAESYP